MNTIKLYTTGTLSPVFINDIGKIELYHPVSGLTLTDSISEDEINKSIDLINAVNAGYIYLTSETGEPISSSGITSASQSYSQAQMQVLYYNTGQTYNQNQINNLITGVTSVNLSGYTLLSVYNTFTGSTAPNTYATIPNLNNHTGNTANPHNTTVIQISGVSLNNFNAFTANTYTQSQINTILNGYYTTARTNSIYVKITGDTMTGNLTISEGGLTVSGLTIITGTTGTNLLRVGGYTDVSTAAIYVETTTTGAPDGIRAFFNSGTMTTSGYITYSYDGSTPWIRIMDMDDDPPYISFETVRIAPTAAPQGTFINPVYKNTFGTIGETANASVGFSWKSNLGISGGGLNEMMTLTQTGLTINGIGVISGKTIQLNFGVSVSGISSNSAFTEKSDSYLATQKATKIYTDNSNWNNWSEYWTTLTVDTTGAWTTVSVGVSNKLCEVGFIWTNNATYTIGARNVNSALTRSYTGSRYFKHTFIVKSDNSGDIEMYRANTNAIAYLFGTF